MPRELTNAPSTGFVDVRASRSHSCALRADGDVFCWGNNSAGQLGDGTRRAHRELGHVPLSGEALQIVVLARRACALVSGGAVWCWGGALEMEDGDDRLLPTQIHALGGRVMAIYSGGVANRVCARKRNGELICWGHPISGEPLPEEGWRIPRPVPAETRRFADLALGNDHACGLLSDGTVSCWGLLPMQDGISDRAIWPPQPSGVIRDAIGLAVTSELSVAWGRSGVAQVWGRPRMVGESRYLASPEGEHVLVATPHPPGACGIVRADDGERAVLCWDVHHGPRRLEGVDRARTITAGLMGVCVTDDAGGLHCWADRPSGGFGAMRTLSPE